tara:strand:+ start:145 stop:945 length:801 start_codon:yes stop_codon:yes gene_type:complete
LKPFLKWAGGKRWLIASDQFRPPAFAGRYIEPFLGGGAVFFHLQPKLAVLSDLNERLVETYVIIRDDVGRLIEKITEHHELHSKDYYYEIRSMRPSEKLERAAQFIYLNRACWNGLYRVNLKGEFNVPIGTKNWILSDSDNFQATSAALQDAIILSSDFEGTIDLATEGDMVFIDPPYTTAHNFNGFVKYNENIFSWDDQIRLAEAIRRAAQRGASVLSTNADHTSVRNLYEDFAQVRSISRASVISGQIKGRQGVTELLIQCGGE